MHDFRNPATSRLAGLADAVVMATSWDPTAAYDSSEPISLKVAETRRRLARGTYQVDLDAVAARLIDTLFKRGTTL